MDVTLERLPLAGRLELTVGVRGEALIASGVIQGVGSCRGAPPAFDACAGVSCRLAAMTPHDLIRLAEPTDAHAIALVQVAGWHAAYRGLMPDAVLDAFTVPMRDAKWRQNLAEEIEGLCITVLVRDARVIAFASSGPCRGEPGVGELGLSTRPRMRGAPARGARSSMTRSSTSRPVDTQRPCSASSLGTREAFGSTSAPGFTATASRSRTAA